MKYISLGCCCETSFVIDRIYGGGKRYPFDWLSIHDFNDVIQAIETDFENFKINEKKEVGWKSLYNNDAMYFSQISNYQIHAVHELDQQTLDRRIERFREAMNEEEHITFILKTHLTDFSCIHPYTSYMPKENVEKLEQAILLHRKDNFTLIVVNESVQELPSIQWVEKDRKIQVGIEHIYGQPQPGSERGTVIIPCGYDTNTKCFDQWIKILNKWKFVSDLF